MAMTLAEKRVKRMKRQGQHQASGQWIRTDLRVAIYLRDEFTCLYCSANLHGTDFRNITLDHVIPKADGGSNRPANLITACLSCNCSKKEKPVEVFTTPERLDWIRRNTGRDIKVYRQLAKALISIKTLWSDAGQG